MKANEKSCTGRTRCVIVSSAFFGFLGSGSTATAAAAGTADADAIPASSDGRSQGRRMREVVMSWLHRWVGSKGRKVAGGELTSVGDKQYNAPAVQDQAVPMKRHGASSRSKSNSIGSLRTSTHSKRSSMKSTSGEYGRIHRRSAIDLTAGARGGTLVKDIRSSAHILSSYTFFVTAHRGSHAKIIKARNKHTSQRVVLKVYDKDRTSSNLLENISKEIRILTLARGVDGIVQLLDSYEDAHQALAILEDCTGGTLISQMARRGNQLNETGCVRHVVKPLLQVLTWLHSKGIVIRDLKPEHMMFDGKGNLRLVDFFSAAVVCEDSLISREGTLAYMAPEMVIKPSPDEIFSEVIGNGLSEVDFPSYNEKVDIWSLGVTVFEVLTGRQPFLAESVEELRCIHHRALGSSGGLRSSLDCVKMREYMSNDALDFLGSTLRVNPDERASAKELLEHPWLKRCSISCRGSRSLERSANSKQNGVSNTMEN